MIYIKDYKYSGKILKGVVIGSRYGCGCERWLVLVLRTHRNKMPRKRILYTTNDFIPEKIKPFDISDINKDWFVIPEEYNKFNGTK